MSQSPPKPKAKTHSAAAFDALSTRGLPANANAEKLILGSILLNDAIYDQVVTVIEVEDFSLEKHRRIFARMADLKSNGRSIDTVTVADELIKNGQLESVDGLSFLMSLTDGLPELPHLDEYLRIVKERSGLRAIIASAQRIIDEATLERTTPQDLIDRASLNFQAIASNTRFRQGDGGQSVTEILESFPGGLGAFLDPTTRRIGLPTGFTRVDEMLGGFHEGELVILAARPSVGKSAMMAGIAEHLILKKKKHVAIFSLEMSKDSILTRMMCSLARVDHQKFRAGYLNREERERLQIALFQLSEARLRVYDDSAVTYSEIERTIRRLVAEEGLHMAAIDYLGLIASHRNSENRNQEVSQMTRGLKLLAKECDIPILLLSQLSRAPEKRGGTLRPMLSDLRDSGSIEQDADVVMFIFREELYKKDRSDLHGIAELIVAKQRNGPIGIVPLRFIGNLMRFENSSYETGGDDGGKTGDLFNGPAN